MAPEPCEDHPDIVISGHKDDQELINFIAEALYKEELKVWYPAASSRQANNVNVDSLITQTKVYIPVLSICGLEEQGMKDRISLAYISSSAIYPVSKQRFPDLSPKIDGGMRLILSRIQWTFFIKDEHYKLNIGGLVQSIKDELADFSQETQSIKDSMPTENPYELLTGHNHLSPHSHNQEDGDDDEEEEDSPVVVQQDKETLEFWLRHFSKAKEVAITSFREKFIADYGTRIAEDFGVNQRKLFENLLIKDVFELQHVVKREKYDAFLGNVATPGPDFFYNRLSAYITARTAMREVFDMESTVRLIAIQQLAGFKTPPVIAHLKQLTEDKDPNTQAVAALALAKTGVKDEAIEDMLIQMMRNKDRLVRESACLSLAHMKSEKAIKPILHLWRNDPIKHVREAAELALSRAGASSAEEAMRITQVLTNEVASLKTLKPVA